MASPLTLTQAQRAALANELQNRVSKAKPYGVSGPISKSSSRIAIVASVGVHAALLAAFVYFTLSPDVRQEPARLAEIVMLPAVNPAPPLIEEEPEPLDEPDRPRDSVQKPQPRQVATVPNAMPLMPARATEPAAPPPPQAAQPGPPPHYLAQLSARLERKKKKLARNIEGIALIRFVIRRDGTLVSCTLARSSGIDLIDREAVALPERAGPFPPIPPDFTGSELVLTVPINFERKRRA